MYKIQRPVGTFKHLHVLKTRFLFFFNFWIASVNIYH